MPDYAEVAGCSTFKNSTQSPLYDSFGAYATTNLVRNVNLFTNPHYPMIGKNNSIYSAPTICHYNTNDSNGGGSSITSIHNNFQHLNGVNGPNLVTSNAKTVTNKMNIIENKIDALNNLNRSLSSTVHGSSANSSIVTDTTMVSIKSVPSTPLIGMSQSGTYRRNRLPKIGHSDKISFGGSDNGRNIEQPLFIKSKEDGSWTSIQNNKSYHSSVNSTNSNKNVGINGDINLNKYKINASNNSLNNIKNSPNPQNSSNNATNPIHLSSFGRADNV